MNKKKNDLGKQFDFWPILRVNGPMWGNILLNAGACDQGGLLLDSKACKDRKSTEENCNGGNFFVLSTTEFGHCC